MMPVKLTKRMFAKGPVCLTPKYVSNGHWAIRRDAIFDNVVFADLATASAVFGLEVLSKADPHVDFDASHEWHATALLYDAGDCVGRLFRRDLGDYACVDRRYLAIAGLDSIGARLWGRDPTKEFTDNAADPQFVVMPITIPAFTELCGAREGGACEKRAVEQRIQESTR